MKILGVLAVLVALVCAIRAPAIVFGVVVENLAPTPATVNVVYEYSTMQPPEQITATMTVAPHETVVFEPRTYAVQTATFRAKVVAVKAAGEDGSAAAIDTFHVSSPKSAHALKLVQNTNGAGLAFVEA